MLAALSLADRGLAERLVQDTFHYVAPPAPSSSGVDTPASSSSGPDGPSPAAKRGPPTLRGSDEDKAHIIGSHLRDKVLGTVEACRDMLSRELPERKDHWTSVSFPFPRPDHDVVSRVVTADNPP